MRWLWTIRKLGTVEGVVVYAIGSTMLYILIRELESTGALARLAKALFEIGKDPMSDPFISAVMSSWTSGCHMIGVLISKASNLTLSMIVVLFGLDILPSFIRIAKSRVNPQPPTE